MCGDVKPVRMIMKFPQFVMELPQFAVLTILLFLQPETARVVWSFSVSDPTDSLGETAQVHDYMGSLSVNLLNGLIEPPPEPANLQYFDVVVSNVRTH